MSLTINTRVLGYEEEQFLIVQWDILISKDFVRRLGPFCQPHIDYAFDKVFKSSSIALTKENLMRLIEEGVAVESFICRLFKQSDEIMNDWEGLQHGDYSIWQRCSGDAYVFVQDTLRYYEREFTGSEPGLSIYGWYSYRHASEERPPWSVKGTVGFDGWVEFQKKLLEIWMPALDAHL